MTWLLRILGLVLLLQAAQLEAQRRPTRLPGMPGSPGQNPGAPAQPGSRDTLGFEQRDDLADSITISYRYLDSLTTHTLDSSIDDFGRFSPVPTGYQTLGNDGNAAWPILFSPVTRTGWDEGLHAFDVYKFNVSNTKFYNTTRPYTLLSYFLGGQEAQVIGVLHTQNIRPNWNAGFDYRLISSPGFFQTQNTNHNNYRLFSSYQGKRKRYAANLVVLANYLRSAENGGIRSDDDLADINLKRRIVVPVHLADNSGGNYKVYSNNIPTGNKYDDLMVFYRHSYDFGKKDSIKVNDSTTNYLFYPKLRLQHSFEYHQWKFLFEDPVASRPLSSADSAFYLDRYDISLGRNRFSDFQLLDEWKMIRNDFTIRQFPQTKNLGQFLEAGIALERYAGRFTSYQTSNNILQIFPPPAGADYFNNLLVHGEYRNKTRNKKWDALLSGKLYAAGKYAGDFQAQARVARVLNQKWGQIEVGFDNFNRTPSFIFNGKSAFNLDSVSLNKKENISIISFSAVNPRFRLMARNISITNYAYFTNYYQKDQFEGLANLTQAVLRTKNKIKGHLNLYSDIIVQQTTGENPIRVPLFYTRQRLAFEGNFFKNLNLSTGFDVRYHTPYKANHYSTLMGNFFPQDSMTISNLPTVNFFLNFRVKALSAFLSAENLNTVGLYDGELAFMNNSFALPHYPMPGFLFRVAVRWSFVN